MATVPVLKTVEPEKALGVRLRFPPPRFSPLVFNGEHGRLSIFREGIVTPTDCQYVSHSYINMAATFGYKMPVNCFLQDSSKGDNIVNHFARGCNGKLVRASDYVRTQQLSQDPAFLWGCLRGSDLVLKHCLKTGHEFYYADNCYYGRKDLFRITRNGLQNTQFVDRPPDRLRLNPVKITGWRRSGTSIVLLPPTESFAHLFNKHDWVADTVKTLRQYTDRPIRVRYKPMETKISWTNGYMTNAGTTARSDASKLTLEQDLADAWAVVAFQSSAVWLAIAMGIPAFVDTMNAASVLGNIDLSKIESPIYNDQEQYFRHINYCHFTLEEIASGFAWRTIQEIPRGTI